MKKCKQCSEIKPLEEFYEHQGMADGHLNICKACKILYSYQYSQTPAGKETNRRRNQKPKRKQQLRSQNKWFRITHPVAYRAWGILDRSVRHGATIRPNYCQRCGLVGRPEGHHKDYSKPLDVVWLCDVCHKKERKEASHSNAKRI